MAADSRGGHRGNYGSFGDDNGRDWNRGGSGMGGGSRGSNFSRRPRSDNNWDRKLTEEMPGEHSEIV